MKGLVMKRNFFLLTTLILSLFVIKVNASSIWFNNPTDGEIITDLQGSEDIIAVYLQWNRQANRPYYEKLFCPPYGTQQSDQGDGISQWWYLPIGTYTWRLELWEYNSAGQSFKTAEQTITFYVKHTIFVSNNFNGGNIKIDGQINVSGSTAIKLTGENLSVGAIDQNYRSEERRVGKECRSRWSPYH